MQRGCKDAVGDGCSFGGGTDVMNPEDVGSGKDGGCVGCGGGEDAGFRRWWRRVHEEGQGGTLCQSVSEKAFAGNSGEDGEVELVELI